MPDGNYATVLPWPVTGVQIAPIDPGSLQDHISVPRLKGDDFSGRTDVSSLLA